MYLVKLETHTHAKDTQSRFCYRNQTQTCFIYWLSERGTTWDDFADWLSAREAITNDMIDTNKFEVLILIQASASLIHVVYKPHQTFHLINRHFMTRGFVNWIIKRVYLRSLPKFNIKELFHPEVRRHASEMIICFNVFWVIYHVYGANQFLATVSIALCSYLDMFLLWFTIWKSIFIFFYFAVTHRATWVWQRS